MNAPGAKVKAGLRVEDKIFFEHYQQLYPECKSILELDKEYLANYGKGERYLFKTKKMVSIEWTNDAKQYPLPEPKYLPVPGWLANWTPETKIMTGSPFLRKIPFSHISGENKSFPFNIHNDGYSEISPYDISKIGTNKISQNTVTAEDLFKMNPKHLTHIPGYFYKTIEERIKLVAPLENLGVPSDIWNNSEIDFVTMMEDGKLNGYHHLPSQSSHRWECGENQDSFYVPTNYAIDRGTIEKHNLHWKNCIWKRPQQETNPDGTPKCKYCENGKIADTNDDSKAADCPYCGGSTIGRILKLEDLGINWDSLPKWMNFAFIIPFEENRGDLFGCDVAPSDNCEFDWEYPVTRKEIKPSVTIPPGVDYKNLILKRPH